MQARTSLVLKVSELKHLSSLPNKLDEKLDAAKARQTVGAKIINMVFANKAVAVAA